MAKRSAFDELMDDLVRANRILANEGVVDAFGHVSVRHPDKPGCYLLSRSRSPDLVTREDIMTFTLEGEALDGDGRRPYGERMIHGAVYERRAEVQAVIHNHSYEVVPFSVVGGGKLRPISHVCAPIGDPIPTWDIRARFGDTDLLVSTMEQGRDLAACLGDRSVALMRGHGCVVAGRDLKETVMTAIYLQVNARLLLQARQLGEPEFLSDGEIERCTERQFSPLALERAWEYWCARARCETV